MKLHMRADGVALLETDDFNLMSVDEGVTWKRMPSCGMADCYKPATFSDGSVGYCANHAEDGYAKPWHIADNPFDEWWFAASVAADIGGELAEMWEGLDHGEWPEQP